MNCFVCNNPTEGSDRCPYCGTDQRTYRRILFASQQAYNEGLERARVRDLTGAENALKRSLKFNKYNREARNLLGLIYFETGETVRALNEWVISKNFYPEGNPVDIYLGKLQNGPNTLDKLNQTARKYNQVLIYCRQGSFDLAEIQLKRVIGMNPKMQKARLLLALLYLRDGRYNDAKKEVSAVLKADCCNPFAVAYLQEIKALQSGKDDGKKNRNRKKTGVDLTDSAEAARSSRAGFGGAGEGVGASIVNILIGLVIGVLACYFLVFPAMKQNAVQEASDALIDANEKASSSAADISALEHQVELLQSQLDSYEGKSDQTTSYEKLIETSKAVSDGDLATAEERFGEVTKDILDPSGQALYDELAAEIGTYTIERDYNEGVAAYNAEDYFTAADKLLAVVTLDEEYADGEALYQLAQSYEKTNNTVDALRYYSRIVELYPNTRRARRAQTAADALGTADAVTEDGVADNEN